MHIVRKRKLVEDFKENSLYKVQKSEHNAFDGVELEAVVGKGPEEDEEGLKLSLEAELEDGEVPKKTPRILEL